MIHICIPSRNEEHTIGVLLWKIRRVMMEMDRDYRVYVLNDGSTDGSGALLNRYRRVMPLAILSETKPVGYGQALEKLLRTASSATKYPKRDAIVTMQGDYTEDPLQLESLIRVFEGGADVVITRMDSSCTPPRLVRLTRRLAGLAMGRGRASDPGGDPLLGFRAHRAVVVRKALRASEGAPLLTMDGWAANVELLKKLTPFARRMATVAITTRYDIRQRRSRIRVLRTVLDVMRMRRSALVALTLSSLTALTVLPTGGHAQEDNTEVTRTAVCPGTMVRLPFAPGEEMRFKVKFGIFSVGEASMSVAGIDTVHAMPAFAVEQRIRAGILGYDLDHRFSSWMDTRTLFSRRFIKDQRAQNRYREYEFFPERMQVQRIDHDTTWALPHPMPLDDISFVYFARTLPLETGETYSLHRFYKDDGNPVVLNVLRRDKRSVGAGEFNTIVVEPIIQTEGLFSEGGKAEIHFSDDEHRWIVYMKVAIPVIPGDMTMHLEEAVPGPAPALQADIGMCPETEAG